MSGALPGLGITWAGRSFLCFDELESTNTYLKENARKLPHGCAVIAKSQTAGKGRLGRKWHNSGETNLALSILLHDVGVSNISCLPLVAGVSVVNALEAVTGKAFSLKWSNDVLFESQKICGILCESQILRDSAFAVVGIGINLTQSRDEFDRLGLVYATSLKLATGNNFEVLPVACEICNQFEPVFEEFSENGIAAIIEKYKKNCVTIGKEVRIADDKTERTGVALDIADDGSLICNIAGKITHIRAGEASVRGIYGYV